MGGDCLDSNPCFGVKWFLFITFLKESDDMMKTKLWKRLTAGMLVMVMTLVFSGVRGNAAEKRDVTYIRDFKLYIAKNSNLPMGYKEEQEAAKARAWFKEKGYTMIEGNLNAGASAVLTEEVGVYMGYSTTTNEKEAVTDLAVMNERGNYSESEYKRILEEQKKMYTDMVSDLKTMLEEYRKNVKKGVPTAIQARDFMNGYFDPDTKEKLGDLLMTISDDNLGTLLMQANGQVVLMIEDRLSYACDTGKTTWLDRMTKLGSYKALEKKALKACNNDINKANAVLDKKYKEDALILLGNWEDIRQHITDAGKKITDWGLDTKSEEEVSAFFNENKDNDEVNLFASRYSLLRSLATYSYEGKSLLDFFASPSDDFAGNGIRKLYPLAASLSDGQISGVNQNVSLFTMVINALGASAFNDIKTGETKEMLDEADEEDKKEVENAKDQVEDGLNTWKEQEAISIYEGVDRNIFKDGVAVTSTAHSYSNGDGKTWADALVGSKAAKGVAIGGAVGSVLFLSGALIVGSMISRRAIASDHLKFVKYVNQQTNNLDSVMINDAVIDLKKGIGGQTREARKQLYEHGKTNEEIMHFTKYKIGRKLEAGFAMACIVLAVADIVTTSITLYHYYNRDHLPIPGYMVDLSYDQEGMTSFVNYKSVPDQNGKNGDVNGGGGKQWLALYQTHDMDAGDPILAPQNGEEYNVIVQYGSADEPKAENYAPLHLFGTPNTAQNLTFADGESGWSFNDGKKGTYVFFRRGALEAEDVTEAEEAEEGGEETATGSSASEESSDKEAVSGSAADLGTTASSGTTVLVGALCGVAGILIGFGAGAIRRKKKVPGDSDSGEE